jgi:hypothetical protein
MSDGSEVCGSHAVRWTTYVRALCFCSRHASNDSFLDPFPLELREGRQDVELQLPSGRRAVDALAQTDEGHADARLRRKGRSLRQIGRRYGRSHITVARWLDRAG